ncbi:unnamed protein product, partial [Allacma fusca]
LDSSTADPEIFIPPVAVLASQATVDPEEDMEEKELSSASSSSVKDWWWMEYIRNESANVVAIDCEMVSVRSSTGKKASLQNGKPMSEVRDEVIKILENNLIVTVAGYGDFAALGISPIRDYDHFDLQWHFFTENQPNPLSPPISQPMSLKRIFRYCFGKEVQGGVHTAQEDAINTMKIFKEGYISLKTTNKASRYNEYPINDENGKQTTVAVCRYCDQTISARAQRIQQHLEKCSNIQKSINKGLDFESFKTDGSNFNSIKDIEVAIARFWFAANLSFNASSTSSWQQLWMTARPGFEPPNRRRLSGVLLDKVYDDVMEDFRKELDGQDVIIMQDGWSDIHQSAIITHAVICGHKAFLIESKDCEDSVKDYVFLSTEMLRVIQLVESTYNAKVIGVTTDNAPVMVKMQQEIKKHHTNMLIYGCSPHMLNHLCKDIIPAGLKERLILANKCFRNKTKLKARLLRLGGIIPQLPNDTRWISNLALVDTFIQNRPKYLQISEESTQNKEKFMSESVEQILNSNEIIAQAKVLRVRLQKIYSYLALLQSNSANVADAMHAWVSLREDLEFDDFKANIAQRMRTAVSDFFYVAYALHPKYRGKEAMIQMLTKMYKCPPGTAAIERIFSTFGLIQTKIRNRLAQKRLDKLAFVNHSLRSMDANDLAKRSRNSDDVYTEENVTVDEDEETDFDSDLDDSDIEML